MKFGLKESDIAKFLLKIILIRSYTSCYFNNKIFNLNYPKKA